jgi:hypothetical protein
MRLSFQPARRLLTGRTLPVVAAAALLTVAGGVAGAATASGTSTVHACYSTKTRALSLARGSRCPSGTRAISWSQSGPKGPAGVVTGYNSTNGKTGVSLAGEFSEVLITSITLPAGHYLISSTANAVGISTTSSANCEIEGPAGTVGYDATDLAANFDGTIALSGAVTLTSRSSIALDCFGTSGVGIQWGELSAVPVAAISS